MNMNLLIQLLSLFVFFTICDANLYRQNENETRDLGNRRRNGPTGRRPPRPANVPTIKSSKKTKRPTNAPTRKIPTTRRPTRGPKPLRSVAEILNNTKSFESFNDFASDIDLSQDELTVFVPVNNAFDEVEMDTLTEQEQEDVIKYHISNDPDLGDKFDDLIQSVNGVLDVETLLQISFTLTKANKIKKKNSKNSKNAEGSKDDSQLESTNIFVQRSAKKKQHLYKVVINGERLRIKKKIRASNGIIYVMNKVIRLESVFPTPSASPSVTFQPSVSIEPSAAPVQCQNKWPDTKCEKKSKFCSKSNRYAKKVQRNCKKECNMCT